MHFVKTMLDNPLRSTAVVVIMAVVTTLIILAVTKQPELNDGAKVPLRVDQQRVLATVSATEKSQARGLAGYAQPDDGQGMLFVYTESHIPSFWMKGVAYPIDIIWIAGETVTEVTAGAQPQPNVPDDRLTRYSPSGPVNRVLEVRAGWAAQYGIQPGDRVQVLSF